jgi:hypothetical protein
MRGPLPLNEAQAFKILFTSGCLNGKTSASSTFPGLIERAGFFSNYSDSTQNFKKLLSRSKVLAAVRALIFQELRKSRT